MYILSKYSMVCFFFNKFSTLYFFLKKCVTYVAQLYFFKCSKHTYIHNVSCWFLDTHLKCVLLWRDLNVEILKKRIGSLYIGEKRNRNTQDKRAGMRKLKPSVVLLYFSEVYFGWMFHTSLIDFESFLCCFAALWIGMMHPIFRRSSC